jgi:hypothetical protein
VGGDADHLAGPQPAQVGMETTSGTVTGAGVAGSSSPGGSAARHAVICSSCSDLRWPALEVWSGRGKGRGSAAAIALLKA